MKDSYGQPHAFDSTAVRRVTAIEASLMPDPEELRLSAQDVADILDYLLAADGHSN